MRERLEAKLAELQEMQTKALADANAISGAIKITEIYLTELEAAEGSADKPVCSPGE